MGSFEKERHVKTSLRILIFFSAVKKCDMVTRPLLISKTTFAILLLLCLRKKKQQKTRKLSRGAGPTCRALESLPTWDALGVVCIVGAVVARSAQWTICRIDCSRRIAHAPGRTESRLVPFQTEIARWT